MDEIVEHLKKELGRYIKSIISTGSDAGLEIVGVNGRYIYLNYFDGNPFMKWEVYENDGTLLKSGRMMEDIEIHKGLGPILKRFLTGRSASDMIAMRVASAYIQAGLADVIEKIFHRVRDSELAQKLTEKVRKYLQTGNPSDDLTLQETSLIYRPDDYGEVVSLSNKKKLDVEWSNHAEYRSDLRDVSPERVNKIIEERLKGKLPHPDKNKIKIREPGLGTAVINYDMTEQPAEADVITVWASEREQKIASRIAIGESVARSVVSFEFPTKDALDKYLQNHPKADKSKHSVKQTVKKNKPNEEELSKGVSKQEDSSNPSKGSGKFEIPSHKSMKYEIEGDLSNVKNWKANIILGNSMGDDHKVGDMDSVGYVAINTKSNEIIPIARADEHQTGHELLYHLSDKGILKSDPEDFITIFAGNNYPDYSVRKEDMGRYVDVVKKWLDYGGENYPIIMTEGERVDTDMKEFVRSNGKPSSKPVEKEKKPGKKLDKKKVENGNGLSEHAKESVSLFEGAARAGAEVATNPAASKRFINQSKSLVEHLKSSKIGISEVDDLLSKAETDIGKEDVASLQEHLFAFNGVKNFLHNYLRELKKRGEKQDDYFGDVDTALEEFDKLGQI